MTLKNNILNLIGRILQPTNILEEKTAHVQNTNTLESRSISPNKSMRKARSNPRLL